MHALLLMPAHELTRLAAIEPARRHARSKRSRQLSCASSSRDAPFVLPRRGRRCVSCPRSLHDPSFDVRTFEARGCASCFSLHGVHGLTTMLAVRFPPLLVHRPRPRSYSPRSEHDRVHFM
jgi:hypothetical protein